MNHLQYSESFGIQLNLNSLEYEPVVIDSLNQAFSKFGKEAKFIFYSFLEVDYKLSKEGESERIEALVNSIEKLFGPTSLLIEIEVMKSIHQKIPSFEHKPGNVEFSFECYLESLRNYLSSL